MQQGQMTYSNATYDLPTSKQNEPPLSAQNFQRGSEDLIPSLRFQTKKFEPRCPYLYPLQIRPIFIYDVGTERKSCILIATSESAKVIC